MCEEVVVETYDGYSYRITEGGCGAEDCEGTIVYGIMVRGNNGEAAKVDDISSLRTVVEKLLELCDRNKVAPANLLEVVEDYLE